MLVSSIAYFNAVRNQYQAQQNIMNTHQMMSSMLSPAGSGAFSGIDNFRSLHALDTQMQLSLEQNKLDYLFNSLWAKQLKIQRQQEIQEFFGTNKIDIQG